MVRRTVRPVPSLAALAVLALVPALAAALGPGTARADRAGDPASAVLRAATDAPAPSADTLEPATLDLGFTIGSDEAPIAVVEFSDFGCPYCARFARTTLPSLRQEFIDAGLVRWRYVPVTFGFAGGELMGAAALCAADQGGPAVFWRVHDLFYERQVALRGADARPRIVTWLAELGVDAAALGRCIDDPDTRARLQRHNDAAGRWYVRGTPTFVINGVPMSGAMPPAFFRQVFATALDPSGM